MGNSRNSGRRTCCLPVLSGSLPFRFTNRAIARTRNSKKTLMNIVVTGIVDAYRLELASHYARVHKRTEMTRTLQGLLDYPQDFSQPRLLVGNFYGELGEWGQALAYFEEGARSVPEQRKSYEKRAVAALIALGKRDEALQLLDKLIVGDPKDVEGRSLRASLWLQSGLAAQMQTAIKAYEELVKENPASPQLHYEMARRI
jgi:tetratricopeptide (TPR) repeat protein